ncbi:MAG: hypothetical protein CMA72_09280 [Euryarchaeota archaeon]|nr:hypothetical protein [Euryarchaeota archaeon]|tara:strand:- start:3210 stop:3554 length:345 start_codon:yes stop_codon:yes gene_type:complete
MPWKQKGKCVFKILKNGGEKKKGCSKSSKKAEKYLKILNLESKDLSETGDFGQYAVDAVNEIVSSLPDGHENKNNAFAKSLLEKIFEIFSKNKQLTREEVKNTVLTLAGNIKIL